MFLCRVSVSRAVKPLSDESRPPDYFSQKVQAFCMYIHTDRSSSHCSVVAAEIFRWVKVGKAIAQTRTPIRAEVHLKRSRMVQVSVP